MSDFVTPLVAAYLEYLASYKSRYFEKNTIDKRGTIPLPRAICKLLYTFCKIRGEKTISRFFNNEPKYLEPMLAAFESWDMIENSSTDNGDSRLEGLIWEERYIMLAWIAHLLLAPFDLSSISSTEPVSLLYLPSLSIELPQELPGITQRTLSICLKYIGSASRERVSAIAALLRLAVRPDMRHMGLLDSLMQSMLTALSEASQNRSIYHAIGILSFIGGILTVADLESLYKVILPTFRTVLGMYNDTSSFIEARSSALIRKVIIKIFRSITLLVLQRSPNLSIYVSESDASSILNEVIDHLLMSVADQDTPVRYAASKALSVITAKLDTLMAAEVVEAVVGSLEEDVLWEPQSLVTSEEPSLPDTRTGPLRRNLSAVNPLRWHGLTLTLAQFLFRRSPPPEQLPQIINALVLALDFEQRTVTGSSVGTNVRDSACFGIWALSRKYTTKELLAVDSSSIRAANSRGKEASVPQLLAVELVIAASVDPVGNIRRGSSAALQELIGRHPDLIASGISLVQVVDYHAVALRSKAVLEVSTKAAKLSDIYREAIFYSLLDWRGVNSPDAESRRLSATAIGVLSSMNQTDSLGVVRMITIIMKRLSILQDRQVEERHGLIVSLASIIDHQTDIAIKGESITELPEGIFTTLDNVSEDHLTSSILKPELGAEAASTYISSISSALNNVNHRKFLPPCDPVFISRSIALLTIAMCRPEPIVITSSSAACSALYSIIPTTQRTSLTSQWINNLVAARDRGSNRTYGQLAVLGSTYPLVQPACQDSICRVLLETATPTSSIETHVAALRAFTRGVIPHLSILSKEMISTLETALNDYTIDPRGDVGSWLRLAGIEAVDAAFTHKLIPPLSLSTSRDPLHKLHSPLIRLAAEKLDKVRAQAYTNLTPMLSRPMPLVSSTSSIQYFSQLCNIVDSAHAALLQPFLEGLSTTIGSGSESTLVAARSAFDDYLISLDKDSLTRWASGLLELLKEKGLDDRLGVGILETLQWVLGAGCLWRLHVGVGEEVRGGWKYTRLIDLTQRAHYKSGSPVKLLAAVKVYVAFGVLLTTTEADCEHGTPFPEQPEDGGAALIKVLERLISMLAHPFPRVRWAVAEGLYLLLGLYGGMEAKKLRGFLKGENWGIKGNESKGRQEKIKRQFRRVLR